MQLALLACPTFIFFIERHVPGDFCPLVSIWLVEPHQPRIFSRGPCSMVDTGADFPGLSTISVIRCSFRHSSTIRREFAFKMSSAHLQRWDFFPFCHFYSRRASSQGRCATATDGAESDPTASVRNRGKATFSKCKLAFSVHFILFEITG
jgi:hypothetical protein